MFTFRRESCMSAETLVSDSDILLSIRTGKNSRVLSYLYETTLKKVRSHIIRRGGNIEQANDIFQDAVIILFDTVRKNKFDERYTIEAFVFTVSKNLWINSIRKNKRISNYEDMGLFGNHITEENILSTLVNKERSEAVKGLFDKLNERCRQILHYYNHEGWSMKEISVKLGFTSEDVAKTSHYRCKKSLMKMIIGNKELEALLRK